MTKLAIGIVLGARLAMAGTCPAAVTSAIERKFPKSTVNGCTPEHDRFEVRVTKAGGGAIEADVTAAGDIVQIEEPVAVDQVPAAVMRAFAAKYPKAKATRAEKQTLSTGKVSYELAFHGDKGKTEATFTEDGTFVEQE